MTIASALTAMNTDIVNARTAITNKGGTVTSGGGSSQLATDIATIPTGSAPVITSLNVTPTTSAQTITAPSGTDGYSPVNVAAVTADIDSDIKASNIKSGVSILGVTGTVTELNGETRTVSLTSSAGNTFTPSSGKNAITSITVTPTNQARTVNPSTSSQSLTVNSGYSGNGTITVNPVTASIDANIQAGNIKKDVQILGVTGTYEGGSTPTGKYKLYERIKPDNYNYTIGTVCGFFIDVNNIEYAVVCLDADYRELVGTSGVYLSSNVAVTNLPGYRNIDDVACWGQGETATFNCDKILAMTSYTSSFADVRELSFKINGVTYVAQIPNISELLDIYRNHYVIDSLDNSGTFTRLSPWATSWSSTQWGNSYGWTVYRRTDAGALITNFNKNSSYRLLPILEIPNN